MSTVKKTVVWRGLFWKGIEFCLIQSTANGWQLEGTVIAVFHKKLMRLQYRVLCNSNWETRSVNIQQCLGRRERKLVLRVDSQKRWWQGSRELSAVRGCVDVDLQFSPITNTLPIRRLQLKKGQGADVNAAWVRLPNLKVALLRQRYTRTSGTRYHYQSPTGFSTELPVDEFGIVKTYPKIWERLI